MKSLDSPLSISPAFRPPASPVARPSPVVRLGRASVFTLRYWASTEVHVFAMAVAANILLSLVPFLIVMVSFCERVLRWHEATNAIYFALNDAFPGVLGDFIVRNVRATVASRPFQLVPLLLLLVTANGIFVPLEVAFNRVWGCRGNRNYFMNQAVSLGLIFLCGGLFLLSMTLTALDARFVAQLSGAGRFLAGFAGIAAFKIAAVPISMLTLFFAYWLLPNCKVPFRKVIPAAVWVGLTLEAIKYVDLLTWPWLRAKLTVEYGPFVYSVTILLYGFVSSMIVLAGAEWAARHAAGTPEDAAVRLEL